MPSGCGEPRLENVEAGAPAGDAERTSVAPPASGDVSLLNSSDKQESDEPPEGRAVAKPFDFTLPADTKPADVTGLDVEILVEATEAEEGYIVELFTPARESEADKRERQSLGSATYVKPLKAGESITISLDAPANSAWITSDGKHHLPIQWETKPGNPKRATPVVKLQISSVTALTE